MQYLEINLIEWCFYVKYEYYFEKCLKFIDL